jgi:hypothetical protein
VVSVLSERILVAMKVMNFSTASGIVMVAMSRVVVRVCGSGFGSRCLLLFLLVTVVLLELGVVG